MANAATAHHSFPAHYLADQIISIDGTVKEFIWRNPHSFIIIEVINDNDQTETWALEWHNTVIMSRMGFNPDTIKPGDKVIVSGNPARNGTHRLRVVTLERPEDGFTLTRTGGSND